MKLRALFLALAIVVVSGALLAVNAQGGKDADTSVGTGSGQGGDASGDAVRNALPVGWNVVQAQTCQLYYGNGGISYQVNATNGAFFWTTIWQFQNVMTPSCQFGHWMAFYVYDGPSGSWSSVYTWTY